MCGCGRMASWLALVVVALLAAGSCRAEGDVVAPPAPGAVVEDQYDKLLGNILGPTAGAPGAGQAVNPLGDLGATALPATGQPVSPLGGVGGAGVAAGAMLSPEEWARRLVGNPKEGADTYGAVLAAWLQSNPEALKALLEGEPPDEDTILRVIEGLPWGQEPTRNPLLAIPSVFKSLCRPIHEAHGDEVAFYKRMSPRARVIMAAYLATVGKGEEMKGLVTSFSDAERTALVWPPGWIVGDTLEAERPRELLPLAIWAWKWEATRLGGDYPVMICWHLVAACQALGDTELVRTEVIPWTERVLGESDGGRDRDWAIAALILGYQAVGDKATAAERGSHWLGEGQKRPEGSYPLHRSEFYLGVAKSSADYVGAAGLFRKLIREAPETWGEAAQEQLVKLAQAHSDLRDVELLPARFGRVWPEKVWVHTEFGARVARTIIAQGSATFRITGASCDVPGAKVEVGQRQFQGGSRQEITLTLGALEQAGEHDGIVTLETNDPEHELIAVPVHMEVASPIKVTPASLFFGFVKPGESKTCTVTIWGAVAFQVKEVRVDKPDVIKATVTAQGDRSYLLLVTLQAPNQVGTRAGEVEIDTDLVSQPRLRIAFFRNVVS